MATNDRTSFSVKAAPRWNKSQLIVVLLMCGISIIAYVQRLSISVLIGPMEVDFALDVRQVAFLLSSFAWGYALFQIPSGWLTDYLGARRMLLVSVLLWSILLMLVSVSSGGPSAMVLWFLVGGIQSCVFSCCLRGLRCWLPISTWARANGLLTSSMYLGGGITTALTAVLLLQLPWQGIYLLYGLLGVAWAIVFGWWYRDHPPTPPDKFQATDPTPPGANNSTIGEVLRMPAVWALMGQQFFRNASFQFFAILFPMFLQQHRGLTLQDAGILSSFPIFATLAGCLAAGWLVDRLYQRIGDRGASRRWVALLGLGLAAGALFSSMWFATALGLTLVMCVGTFGAAFAGVAAFTTTMDVGRERTGMVFGMMNTCGNLGGALTPMVAGEIIYRTGNWNMVVALCAGMYILAGLCWVMLHVERDQSEHSHPAAPSVSPREDPTNDRLRDSLIMPAETTDDTR